MYDDEGGNQMFYHNQQPYPGQPYYPQNAEQHAAITDQELHVTSQPQYSSQSDFVKKLSRKPNLTKSISHSTTSRTSI